MLDRIALPLANIATFLSLATHGITQYLPASYEDTANLTTIIAAIFATCVYVKTLFSKAVK